MPELLVVATTAALDTRDLVRALDRRDRRRRAGPRRPAACWRRVSRARGSSSTAPGPAGRRVLVLAPGGPGSRQPRAPEPRRGPRGGPRGPRGPRRRGRRCAERETLRAHGDDRGRRARRPAGARGGGRRHGRWRPGSRPSRPSPPPPAWRSPRTAGGRPRPTPDPRSAGRERIGEALLEIVGAEGPVLASRAYGLLNKAAGGKKLTSIVRAPLSGAAYRLRQQGLIAIDDEQGEEVLRLAGTPAVRVRDLGPRTLDEVPARRARRAHGAACATPARETSTGRRSPPTGCAG